MSQPWSVLFVTALVSLVQPLLSSPIAHAQGAEIWAGRYQVVSRDCLDTGTETGSIVQIQTAGPKVRFVFHSRHPFAIQMNLEAKVVNFPDGRTLNRVGGLFPNALAYGEVLKRGPVVMHALEYVLREDEPGKFLLQRTEGTLAASHVTTCDLVRR